MQPSTTTSAHPERTTTCHQVTPSHLQAIRTDTNTFSEAFLPSLPEGNETQKKQKTRWGPVPEGFQEEYKGLTEKKKKKRRKSRWEQPAPGEEGAIIARPMFPKELTLPGGIRVIRLPVFVFV